MTNLISSSPIASLSSTTASSAPNRATTSRASPGCLAPFCRLELTGGGCAPEWSDPPAAPALVDGEVHLWRLALDRRDTAAADFLSVLSTDERARARRFFFVDNRRQFILGRGWLRTVLSRYTDAAPGALVFRYGPHGKPALAGDTGVSFNLAHSDALALVAVTRGRAVGVDVERVRPVADAPAVAERFFSPREQLELQRVPMTRRTETFLRFWTAKEACAKAMGCGLDEKFQQLDVTAAGNDAIQQVNLPDEAGRATLCRLASFAAAPDHIAAVALVDV